MNLFPLLVPAGNDTEVQFNDGGLFAGDSTFTFNKTTKILGADGLILSGTTAIGLDMSGGTFATAIQKWPGGTIKSTGDIAFQGPDSDTAYTFRDAGSIPILTINTAAPIVTLSSESSVSSPLLHLRNDAGVITKIATIRTGFVASGQTWIQNASNYPIMLKTSGGVSIGNTNTDPQANLHVGDRLTNTHYDSEATGIFEEREPRLQFIAEDSGNDAGYFIFTNVPSSGDNKHWLFGHRGPSRNNNFEIGYKTSSSSSNIATGTFADFVITKAGDIGFGGEPDPETLTEWTHAQPYLTLHNSTHEDSDGGRESRLIFTGEKLDGTEHTLAITEVGHDGTGDDYDAYWKVSLNATTGGVDTLIDRFKLDSVGATIYSADASDNIRIFHDNTEAYIVWNDGKLMLQSDEENSIGFVEIRGTGTGYGFLNVLDNGNNNKIRFHCINGRGFLDVFGTSPIRLAIQGGSNIPVTFFEDATTGSTPKLIISGYRTGDSKRSLNMQMSSNNDDTFLFDNVGHYEFRDGTFILANRTHSDADGAGATSLLWKRERSGSEEADIFSITGSHDGPDDDEKGKVVIGVNTGAGVVDVVKIDSSANTKIGDLTGVNQTVIEADGTIRFDGDATVWNDLVLPLSSARVPAANAPSWTSFIGNLNNYTYGLNDFQEFSTELEHGYKGGSTFQFHIHGAVNGSNVDDRTIKFEIEYTIADTPAESGFGDVYPATTTINGELTIPADTVDLTAFSIDIGTNATGSFVQGAIVNGRVRRIASTGTEPTGDPFLTEVGIHAEDDTIGTRTAITK